MHRSSRHVPESRDLTFTHSPPPMRKKQSSPAATSSPNAAPSDGHGEYELCAASGSDWSLMRLKPEVVCSVDMIGPVSHPITEQTNPIDSQWSNLTWIFSALGQNVSVTCFILQPLSRARSCPTPQPAETRANHFTPAVYRWNFQRKTATSSEQIYRSLASVQQGARSWLSTRASTRAPNMCLR